MKTIDEFMSYLSSLDIKLWVDGDRLHCNAPQGILSSELSAQLKNRKIEILKFLHEARFASNSIIDSIQPVPRDVNLPLSFAQQRLWFLNQLEPHNSAYNIHVALRLIGSLNVGALERSLNEIVQRHEALRTTFTVVDGEPIQIIAPTLTLKLPVVNLQQLAKTKQEAEVLRLSTQQAQFLFDLTQAPLLQTTLLQLSEQEYVVLFTMHHIVSDGWSMEILIQEVGALYEAFSQGQPSPLPELPIQYVDFAAWQRQWLTGEVLESQLSYWRQQLDGAPPVLELPTDHSRLTVGTLRSATYSFELSQELSVALNKLSQQQGTTLFMTLLAAFKVLLWRYTCNEDIVVGSPIANRNRVEIEGLIGFFVNTLVLQTNLGGNPSFSELLTRVRQMALGAYAHQDLPFEQLVEELQPQRDLSHTPLFQIMFVLQNAPMSALELPDLTLSYLASESNSSQFDLTLDMRETAQGISGILEYNSNLFESSTISRMAGHLQTLLEGIVANPQARLSELPLLTEPERQTLLVDWNQTQAEYPQHQCIHQLFEAQVERTPDAVAIVFEDRQLTYRELNTKANQLAHKLRSLGVKPEVLVGLCTQRSIEMIIGLLAILKAGGAYVPIDPAYPQQRLALMLTDAQLSVLLTQQHLLAQLPTHTAKVVCFDDASWQVISSESSQNPVNQTNPANLAYVIYTSGSTGIPKGVTIQHQSLVNFIQAAITQYELQVQDRILQFASISFDVACEEIFSCLLRGATLVLRTDDMLASIGVFLEKCQQQCISVIDIPTVFWHQLTSELSTSSLKLPESLRLVIIGSDKALPDKVHTWREQVEPRVRLVNAYGPTETTVGVTFCDLTPTKELVTVEWEVPIGQAIANIQTYVLNADLKPVPIGVWGELCIGGIGVARGYLHQPELTAQKFVPNPFSNRSGTRLYKTGDLVRYRSDGQIEFNGRVDNQVKIRGFRIELGEIEAILSQHPEVRETVVVAREDYSNDKCLVAYVVPQLDNQQTSQIDQRLFAHHDITVNQKSHPKNLNQYLRDYLKKSLPNYMVPVAFVMLDALPLTPNNKVDHKALPAPDTARPELEAVYQPPQTKIEKTIAILWQELLHIENIGIDDNFFELGGHSLLLVQVHSKLREIFKSDLSVVDLFRYPTIISLANYFHQVNNNQSSFYVTDIDTEKIEVGKAQQRKRLQKVKSIENI